MDLDPKKYDIVVFDSTRGVVMDVRGATALVSYSLPNAKKVLGAEWIHKNRLTLVARRRAQLTGEEPAKVRVLEVRDETY